MGVVGGNVGGVDPAPGPSISIPTRVTIDSNVIHAHCEPQRDAHADAVWLIDAAERREFALTVAAQGSRFDLGPGMVADRLRDLTEAGTVRLALQVSRLSSETYLGDGLWPGNAASGLWKALSAEV